MGQDNNNAEDISILSSEAHNRVKKKHRVRNIVLFTTLLLLVGIAFLSMYLLYWRYEVVTDDSYVNGHIVYVNTQVSGVVNQVLVEDTDEVKRGDLLILLDKEDYQLAYDKALSDLKKQVSQFKNLNHSAQQMKLSVNVKKTALAKVKQDYRRRLSLLKAGAISQEELSHLKLQVAQAEEDLNIARQNYQIALNNVDRRTVIAEQPAIKAAIVGLKQAWLNLQRTEIRAPISGQIEKRNIQIGQKVTIGQNLLSVVSPTNFWVDANFKESQLKKIRKGQSVEMVSDLYGSEVVFHGNVVGLSAGTGNAFSVLPAQNASGNWIKVVQRVPVRVALKQEEIERYPLKIGLSMKTKVFSRSDSGQGDGANIIIHQDNKERAVEPIDYSSIDGIIADILSQVN